MSRFPPIPVYQLSDAQKRAHEGIAKLFLPFPVDLKWKNDEGLVLGPYAPLFYTDDLSDQWFALSLKVTQQDRLTTREKELCIFAVLSEYDVPFVHYAHSQIGLWVGFSKEQVQQAVHGKLPTGLGPRESAIYSLALALAKLRRPLNDDQFEEARGTLRRDEVVGIVHIVSGYIYVAMLSNVSVAGVPEVQPGTFQATKNPGLVENEDC